MSTFKGRIKEYPAIAIDFFIPNDYSKYFVLSHVHKDHTRGLEDSNFKHKIYCSETTAKLLPLMETRTSRELMYSQLKDYVVGVEYGVPVAIETIEYGTVQLTFFPANHCLGASLVLIEGENGTVLYTGDMRAEPSFVEQQLQCLKKYRIKNLYMDTTCCYEDRRAFVSKEKSLELLINLINSYPKNFHFYLDNWTVGYEELWITIVDIYKQKVHVSEQRYNLFCKTEPIFDKVLTIDASSTRFHSCQWDAGCFKHEANTVAIHPTPNRNTQPYEYVKGKSRKLLATDLPFDYKPFQRMILPFSTHSSLEEIVYFYKFIRPREFTPCVVHGEWEQLSKMMRLLKDEGCNVDTTSSSSDIERENHTDSSKSSASASSASNNHARPIATNETSARSSIHYVSTAETSSTAGSKTLSGHHPNSASRSSASHSATAPPPTDGHSHSAHISNPRLPVISEDDEEIHFEEQHNSVSPGDGIALNESEENPIASKPNTSSINNGTAHNNNEELLAEQQHIYALSGGGSDHKDIEEGFAEEQQHRSASLGNKRPHDDTEENPTAEQRRSASIGDKGAHNDIEENPIPAKHKSPSLGDIIGHNDCHGENSNVHAQHSPLTLLLDNDLYQETTHTRRSSLSLDSRITSSKSKKVSLHRSGSSLTALSANHCHNIPIQRRRSLSLNNISKRQTSSSSLHFDTITRNNINRTLSSLNHHTTSPSQPTSLSIQQDKNNNIPNTSSSSRNVIYLSMSDSLCSMNAEEQFSIFNPPFFSPPTHSVHELSDDREVEKENCRANFESNDGQRPFITKETTRNFLKKIKVQKRKQIKDKNFGTKNKPICL